MRQLSILHGCAFFLLLPAASSLAQTKDEVFEGLVDTEQAGYASVENYLLKTETMGMSTSRVLREDVVVRDERQNLLRHEKCSVG